MQTIQKPWSCFGPQLKTDVQFHMASKQKHGDDDLKKIPSDILANQLSSFIAERDLLTLSITNKQCFKIFKPTLVRKQLLRDLELEKIAKNIDAKLPSDIKRHILTFFGKIGTKDFRYSRQSFTDKNTAQLKFPTFYGNLIVLWSYIDRTKLAEMIALNLLWHIKVDETLTLAHKNPKSLAIPVKNQDPYGQWIEATPLQTVYAAGDRSPPNMNPEAKPFGLVERLASCFENPANAHKQIAEWEKDSKKATEETMAPYIAAMRTTCEEIIESKEITDNLRWEELLILPFFLQLAENFRLALAPDPKHVVRSGLLFSMKIFLDLIAIFEANVDNEDIEDKARLNLGGWWSRKSDALDTVVYPALQARSQRCDLGIFQKGIGNVANGQTPDRLDFSNGSPGDLTGIGTTHFYGFFGDKFTVGRAGQRGAVSLRMGGGWVRFFETCFNQKQQQLDLRECSHVPYRIVGTR